MFYDLRSGFLCKITKALALLIIAELHRLLMIKEHMQCIFEFCTFGKGGGGGDNKSSIGTEPLILQ